MVITTKDTQPETPAAPAVEPETVAPAVDPAPVAPKRTKSTGLTLGEAAKEDRWGIIDATGAVAPTASAGRTTPEAGTRAIRILAEGDVVTTGIIAQLTA